MLQPPLSIIQQICIFSAVPCRFIVETRAISRRFGVTSKLSTHCEVNQQAASNRFLGLRTLPILTQKSSAAKLVQFPSYTHSKYHNTRYIFSRLRSYMALSNKRLGATVRKQRFPPLLDTVVNASTLSVSRSIYLCCLGASERTRAPKSTPGEGEEGLLRPVLLPWKSSPLPQRGRAGGEGRNGQSCTPVWPRTMPISHPSSSWSSSTKRYGMVP